MIYEIKHKCGHVEKHDIDEDREIYLEDIKSRLCSRSCYNCSYDEWVEEQYYRYMNRNRNNVNKL